MGSLRRRFAVMEAVGMKMLEEGKVLSKSEYDRCRTVPVRSPLVLNQFGSWSRLVRCIESDLPALWAEIHSQQPVQEPKKESKKEVVEDFDKDSEEEPAEEPGNDALASLRAKAKKET